MSVDELQQGNERPWKIAYSWRSIATRLRSTAAPWYVAALTNLGYRHYAHNLDRFYTCDTMFMPKLFPSLEKQTVPASRPLPVLPEELTLPDITPAEQKR